MTRIRSTVLAITSVLVVAAATAATASASTPQWFLAGSALGATLVGITSTNLPSSMTLTEATQKFENAVESVECANVTSTGSIWNEGSIGKDKASIKFTGCKVFKGKTTTPLTECTVENAPSGTPGTINVSANTELVYLKGENTAVIGDLFSPTSGTTFVELNFVDTGTGTSQCKTSGITKVTGSVVANMLVGLGNEPKGGTVSENAEGFLKFPTTAITKYFNGSTLTESKAGLKVFGTEIATQSGESLVAISGYSGKWGVN